MDKVRRILIHRGHHDIAELLKGGRYEINQSSTYGSYLFSQLSMVEVYVPLNAYDELINLPDDKKQLILDAFLTIHPPKDHSIEITGVEYYADVDVNLNPENAFKITIVTRKNILDEILLISEDLDRAFWGKLNLVEFLKRIWPLDSMPAIDYRFKTASEDIWQHVVGNDDWSYIYLFEEYLGLFNCSDEQFRNFLEQLVHPLVRTSETQEQYVSVINHHLRNDGYQLIAREQISGYPIYRVVSLDAGIQEKVKNLIFAADGPKPELILSDSLNNDIQIVKNAEYCLVFDRPIPHKGLRWGNLVEWWASRSNNGEPTIETERDLYRRLLRSLASEPEKLLFETYFGRLRPELRDQLPALIPQVYLHYDPYTLKQLQNSQRVSRQRMDFLILFSNHERIIIEVDGKQHYAEDDTASPRKYAEMVSADRQLRLTGYEIYRFGGYELQGDRGKDLVETFFRGLFQKHGIPIK